MPVYVLIGLLVIFSAMALMFYIPRDFSPIQYLWQKYIYFGAFLGVWVLCLTWVGFAYQQPFEYERIYESQVYKIQDHKFLLLDTGVMVNINELDTPEGNVTIKVPQRYYLGLTFYTSPSEGIRARKYSWKMHELESK